MSNENNKPAATVSDRLLDGYDGDGSGPPPEFIEKMMRAAPPEVRERAAQWAKDREALGGQGADEKAGA